MRLLTQIEGRKCFEQDYTWGQHWLLQRKEGLEGDESCRCRHRHQEGGKLWKVSQRMQISARVLRFPLANPGSPASVPSDDMSETCSTQVWQQACCKIGAKEYKNKCSFMIWSVMFRGELHVREGMPERKFMRGNSLLDSTGSQFTASRSFENPHHPV